MDSTCPAAGRDVFPSLLLIGGAECFVSCVCFFWYWFVDDGSDLVPVCELQCACCVCVAVVLVLDFIKGI